VNNTKFKKSRYRGSMLLAVILVITVLSILAGGILTYSYNNYRSCMRQNLLDQARLRAEGEMEFLFLRWKNQVLALTTPTDIAATLTTANVTVDWNNIKTSDVTPIMSDGGSWTTSRAIRVNGDAKNGSSSVSGSTRVSQISSYTALTRVAITDPILGNINYQIGRRLTLSNTSLFQFSVFYQDRMEFSTGSPMTIKGDISSNANLYIGAQSGVALTLLNNVFFVDSFNGQSALPDAIDPAIATTLTYTGTSSLVNPIFNSDTVQLTARANQIKKLEEAENFLGGTNAAGALTTFGPTSTGGTGAYATTNDVYRSVIAPPPTNSSGAAIIEDPVVAANRMHEKAGIIIEVRKTTDTDYATRPIKIYTKSAPAVDYAVTNPSLVASIISSIRSPVFDTRENTDVNMTTLNVGNLRIALDDTSGTPAALRNAYNGIIYVKDSNPQSAASGSTAAVLNGLRITNGAQLPYREESGKPRGFTVATDGGLYIQGNYNTVTQSGAPSNTAETAGNPATLMGDAITLLSSNWDDTKASADVYSRNATSTTVYSALLSGNTPTNSGGTVNSGGVQNLIRLMENWTGQDVSLIGSLGQLFTSKYFTGAIRATGSGTGKNLYLVPRARNLTFDTKLASSPPNGAPTTTRFERGDYFIWKLSDDVTKL
jgi:hypothetical protein